MLAVSKPATMTQTEIKRRVVAVAAALAEHGQRIGRVEFDERGAPRIYAERETSTDDEARRMGDAIEGLRSGR